MIPKTEAEAIAQLKRVENSLNILQKGMMEISNDPRYSKKDREDAECIREFTEANAIVVSDVITGLSQIFSQKNPQAISAIIAELTKK